MTQNIVSQKQQVYAEDEILNQVLLLISVLNI